MKRLHMLFFHPRNGASSRARRSTANGSRRALLLVPVSAVLALAVAVPPATAAIHDGGVLPASSTDHGWTLEHAITATSAWNSTDRHAAPPRTPFQILYVTGDGQTSNVGNGIVVRNSRSFRVPSGTSFFLPVAFADDTPPVAGTFPTTHTQALNYWYGAAEIGTRGATVSIDGRATPLSHGYLVGPLRVVLSDGKHGPRSGRIVEEAAFLAPLPRGKHVVSFSFTWAGGLIGPALETGFYTAENTFPITVT